jgi:hypothetical protein
MKTKILPLLILAAAVFLPAADSPRVNRGLLAPVEKSLDDRFARLWPDNPLALLGSTRGVYLEGYGVVLTAEVNMVIGGTSLMQPRWTDKDKEMHHKKKLERLPQLRTAMKQALAASAASLDPVAPTEQIVLSVFLSRYPWEDATGIPAQVTMQAPKAKLLEAQRTGSLDQAIQVKEF